mgnify:CR=1 FL=1
MADKQNNVETKQQDVETKQQDVKTNPAKVFSVAPGVVDTEMQDEIRVVEPENFRELEQFVQLKQNGQLTKPEDVGKQYANIMLHPEKYPDMLMDLRE